PAVRESLPPKKPRYRRWQSADSAPEPISAAECSARPDHFCERRLSHYRYRHGCFQMVCSLLNPWIDLVNRLSLTHEMGAFSNYQSAVCQCGIDQYLTFDSLDNTCRHPTGFAIVHRPHKSTVAAPLQGNFRNRRIAAVTERQVHFETHA